MPISKLNQDIMPHDLSNADPAMRKLGTLHLIKSKQLNAPALTVDEIMGTGTRLNLRQLSPVPIPLIVV
jgi:hypothetical protein